MRSCGALESQSQNQENPGAEASNAEIRASINPIDCGKKGGHEKLWGSRKPIAEPREPWGRRHELKVWGLSKSNRTVARRLARRIQS